MSKQNAYVFIVCGDNDFISTLNLSLHALKKFSKNKIIVVTDLSRNASEIEHDTIIDVKTNSSYSHHQAAIFLKTSIHRYLDMDNFRYCYLDNDILAISSDVDGVFEQAFEIIGFCPDNITFDYFSPYAVHCECIEKAAGHRNVLNNAIQEYSEIHEKWESVCNSPDGRKLEQKLNIVERKKFKHWASLVKYVFQKYNPFTKNIFLFDCNQEKQSGKWFNKQGELILYPIKKYKDFVENKTGFRYNHIEKCWTLPGGTFDVTKPRCRHLHDEIKKQFNIEITPENWQHPNGGLFLFDKNSVCFLERWHELSLKIFTFKEWKVRDQGSLAVTFWEYDLHRQKLIPETFNYILDYNCEKTAYHPEMGYTKNNFQSYCWPKFVHIFHHFGDKDWPLWNETEKFIR
ncbi:MAG TPA: hypothetical protein PKW80_08610 [Bacteroidales bacterium]|nr:hypothetical protein [Bacteroidales bacterium]